MPSERLPSRVMVLAEDSRQQDFVRAFLQRVGFRVRQIRFEPLAQGGSGEQWVRRQYPNVVEAYRQRASSAKTAAVIITDADLHTVEDRLKQLTQALPQKEERIAHLIPKHSIETWILCLTGESVDEDTPYKKARPGEPFKTQPAAIAFFEWSRANAEIPHHCVPSLRRACFEIRRVD